MRVEESRVLLKVGRLGRVKPNPCQPSDLPASGVETPSPKPPEVAESRPTRPNPELVPVPIAVNLSEAITDEQLREFLDLPAIAA